MKKIFIGILLAPILTYSQIEISDASTSKKEIQAIKYDGSFIKLEIGFKEEIAKGLVGEKVTLINVPYSDLKKQDGSRISYSEEKNFQNKTFDIIGYSKDVYDTYTIRNDEGVFIWKVGSSGEYVFNKFIEKTKEKFINKSFIPLYLESKVKTLSESEITLIGDKSYKITNVKYTKLSYFEYGMTLVFNNDIEFIYPTKWYEQRDEEGYLNIQSNDLYKSKVLLIEESQFNKLKDNCGNYFSKIRTKNVAVGMTREQCTLAWGSHSKAYKNLANYDEVLVYGDVSNSQTLYFKGGILKLIK